MKDFIPKPADIKTRGLGPKAQKLLALREKAEQASGAGNSAAEGSATTSKTKGLAGTRKTSFNRKAV